MIIHINRVDGSGYVNPYQVYNAAHTMRRVAQEKDKVKLKFLVDLQVLTLAQLYSWANEEYKSLPKCYYCAAILSENVFTHKFRETELFCTQTCADKDYSICVERSNEEEDFEYL